MVSALPNEGLSAVIDFKKHKHRLRFIRRSPYLYWFACRDCSAAPVRSIAHFWPGTGAL